MKVTIISNGHRWDWHNVNNLNSVTTFVRRQLFGKDSKEVKVIFQKEEKNVR